MFLLTCLSYIGFPFSGLEWLNKYDETQGFKQHLPAVAHVMLYELNLGGGMKGDGRKFEFKQHWS